MEEWSAFWSRAAQALEPLLHFSLSVLYILPSLSLPPQFKDVPKVTEIQAFDLSVHYSPISFVGTMVIPISKNKDIFKKNDIKQALGVKKTQRQKDLYRKANIY